MNTVLANAVLARFICMSVQDCSGGGSKFAELVSLRVVYSDDPTSPNYSWSQATPSGQLYMTITNPNAFGAFVPDVEYDLKLTPVPPAVPAPSMSVPPPITAPRSPIDAHDTGMDSAPSEMEPPAA